MFSNYFKFCVRSRGAAAIAALMLNAPTASALTARPTRPTSIEKKIGGVKRVSARNARNLHRVVHTVQVDGSMNNADLQSPSICAASCFAATYSFSTVPYYSLDQPRNVTIVYNGDQASPRPFIFADVNGQDGTGVQISAFTMSATLNGSPVTFIGGSTSKSAPGVFGWFRMGAQFDASNLATNIYPLVVTLKTMYTDGATVTSTINSSLMVVNEKSSPIAKGWTIAGVQHLYSAIGGGYLVTAGDGSGIRFAGLGATASDFSKLTFDGGSSTYTRTYNDGSRVIFNSVGQETSAIEVNGTTHVFSYDAQGRLAAVFDPIWKQRLNGSPTAITLGYDANGLNMVEEPDKDGLHVGSRRQTIFAVDANRCLVAAQDPGGGTTGFSCDASGRLSTITDRRGGVTTIGYGTSWKLSQVTLPQIPVDAGGGATTLANPVVHYAPWQIVPPALVQNVKGSVQDAAGRTTFFKVNRFGLAIDVTAPTGLHTLVSTSGILPTKITYPSGLVDSASYDALGRVTTTQSTGSSVINYHYGVNGLVDIISGPGARTDNISYNANNQVSREAFSGSPVQVVRYTYDLGTRRVASVTDSSGHTTTFAYEGRLGNVDTTITPGNRVSARITDIYGRDSALISPSLAPKIIVYDLLNRVRTSSDSIATITLAYDSLFQTDLSDVNGNHYHTDYNALGLPIQQCDPLVHCSSSRYDASGMIMSTTNRRGQILSLTRDGAGRVTSKSGANTITDNYGYSSDGRTMVAWNTVERDSVFASAGLLNTAATDSVVTWIDGKRYRIYHRYPKATADVDSVRIISNTGTIFSDRVATYSASGFLGAFSLGSSTIPFTPDADGTGGTLSYPGFDRTGTALATHWTGSAMFSNGLGTTFERAYHYSPGGQIDQVMLGSGHNSQQTFTYDRAGRLTGKDVRTNCSFVNSDLTSGQTYNCSTVLSTDSYAYDPMGNRIDHGGAPTTGNRYVVLNGGSYYYDADGNVIQKYKDQIYNYEYSWNAENQLDSTVYNSWSRTYYDYNALGKPVRTWDGDPNGRHVSHYLLWDGEALVAELDPNGQRQVDYAYLPGTIDHPFAHTLGATTPSVVRFHEMDELGNVEGTSESGLLRQTNTYDAWGKDSVGGNLDQHLFWKGLFWNSDITGLYYVRNRWYDPEGGRFVNEDPAGFAGGMNLYAFGGNDPVNAKDPAGLSMAEPCTTSDIASALEEMASSGAGSDFSYNCASLETVFVDGVARELPEPPVPRTPGGNPNLSHGGIVPGGGRRAPDVGETAEAMCAFRVLTTVGTAILDTFGAGEILRSGRAFASALYHVARKSDPNFHFLGSIFTQGTRIGVTGAQTAMDNGTFASLIGGAVGESARWWEFMPIPYVSVKGNYDATKRACFAPGPR